MVEELFTHQELTPMVISKKLRIFRETVKDQHTSHWDMDLLSHAELAALLGKDSGNDVGNMTPNRAGAQTKSAEKADLPTEKH